MPDHADPESTQRQCHACRGWRLWQAIACEVTTAPSMSLLPRVDAQDIILSCLWRLGLILFRSRRLAAFICGHEVFQVSVSSTYGLADFRENLLRLYAKVTA